jgi:putative transcriptional regulator
MARTEARLGAAGAVTRRRSVGPWEPVEPRTDWARVDATTKAEIERQAAFDDAEAARDGVAWVQRVRRRAGLSQAEFARRIGISVATVRSWEQGKLVPQGAARALLHVIDRVPEAMLALIASETIRDSNASTSNRAGGRHRVDAEPENTRRLYMLIGKFIFSFSELEFLLRHTLAEVLKIDNKIFYPVTTGYDFATLCRVTQSVCKIASPYSEQERDEIGKVLKSCLRLNDERVRIAHGTWFMSDTEVGTDHVSRQKLEPETYYSHIEELEKVIYDLNLVIWRLIAFLTLTGVILRPTTTEALAPADPC